MNLCVSKKSFKIYLLADVYVMYDLWKMRNVSRVNMSLNERCLENVHEDKMKASNNKVNKQSNEKRKLAHTLLLTTRNPD